MVGAAPRLTFALAMAVLAGAAPARAAPSDALRAEAQCREGQMQGGYSLRDANGRLRAQGAYNVGQRVGSFIFWNDAGARLAHIPFDADDISGTVSLWFDSAAATEGAHRLEAAYRRGERHGPTRAWYPDGHLRLEAEYAQGALQAARAWSETGAAYDASQSRTQAEQEYAADAQYVDGLIALVRRHPADCSAPPPANLRARTATNSKGDV